MLPCFSEWYGNASSKHFYGWQAEELVAQARQQVAELVGADPAELIFTSGATESINLALKGLAATAPPEKRHIISVATEHKAVLEVMGRLERSGFRVTLLPVDRFGLIDLANLEEALTEDTLLVSVMTANNEIGVLQPIEEIVRLCHERGVLFHTDAAQAIGKIPFDINHNEADLVSFSGHKMYGPKGIGALVVRKRRPRIRLIPQMDGGGHERGLRSGTLNVPAIVGFGEACQICREEMPEESARMKSLRDRLQDGLSQAIENLKVNGHPERRLPHSLNISIPDVEGDALITGLSDLAISSGAACVSSDPEPSHVLRAIGLSDPEIRSSLRMAVGRFTTAEEIDYAIGRVSETVGRLQSGQAVPAR